MATVGSNKKTLVDVAKELDPEGKVAPIAELLSQYNEMLPDIPWYPSNDTTGHVMTIRTKLPTVGVRRFNEGRSASKSRSAQIVASMCNVSGASEIDVDVLELYDNPGEAATNEDKAFFESMSNKVQSLFIYGNEQINPAEMTGFIPRINSLSAVNGSNIINAGGSGSDNASILVVGWGERAVHGIYPKGSKAGLYREDMGKQYVYDANNRKYLAYVTDYKWKPGLAVHDWRRVGRVANISTGALKYDASSGANLPQLLGAIMTRTRLSGGVSPVIYMNRTVMEYFEQQMANATKQSTLRYEDVGGIKVPFFKNAPIRLVDAMLSTEDTVS